MLEPIAAYHQRLYWINQILPVNYIEFLQYKSIFETLFPVKLLCNGCIVESAIQIILYWVEYQHNREASWMYGGSMILHRIWHFFDIRICTLIFFTTTKQSLWEKVPQTPQKDIPGLVLRKTSGIKNIFYATVQHVACQHSNPNACAVSGADNCVR